MHNYKQNDTDIIIVEGEQTKSRIALMRMILVGLLEETKEIREEIKTKGIVPREVCKLCDACKREIVDFSPKERKVLKKFKEWIAELKVTAISQSMAGQLFLKTTRTLKGLRADHKDDEGCVYALHDPHDTRSKRYRMFSKARNFLSKYDEVETCHHFGKPSDNILRVEYHTNEPVGYGRLDHVPQNLVSGPMTKYRLFLCCDDCRTLIRNTMCDRVRKRGIFYDFECPVEDIVLRKRLLLNGLEFEHWGGEDETNEYAITSHRWRSYLYYLSQNSIIISRGLKHARARTLESIRDATEYPTPELIVVFDKFSNLPLYLELNVNILFYNEDGLSFYDKNRQPEANIRKICERIVNNLNVYVEKERGSEHDRVISALYSIGRDLGYVPQKEYGKSGIRIDCVWFDREGKIQVAAEVETTATWKKDLISTWEVEPKLAIIVGFPKTDKVAQNLMQAILMKYTPHNILYINKQTDHAFLFDKQEIVEYYNLEKEKEDSKSSIVRTL